MKEIKRKYFEVWGDLEIQNNTLRLLSVSLIGLLILSVYFNYKITKKPPVVIRVETVGKADAISDYRENHQVTEPELFYFAKLFIQKFTEYNAYTVATDIAEAMNLMTANYQKVAKKEILDSNLISQISQSSLQSTITIREMDLVREDESYSVLSFLGLRSLGSYEDRNFQKESLFKGDIILKKVPRTMLNPQGLLVEEYREVLVKELDT